MRSNFNTMINYEIFMTNYEVYENDLVFIKISLFTHKFTKWHDFKIWTGWDCREVESFRQLSPSKNISPKTENLYIYPWMPTPYELSLID